MACERYRDALRDLAAGGRVPALLEPHLASCEGCREELALLRRALAMVDTEMARLVAEEPSPALAARIRQAVAVRDAAPAWRPGWLWPVAAAAAMLLVALAVWVGRAPSPAPRVAVEEKMSVPPGDTRPPADGGEALSAAPERTERRGSAITAAPSAVAPVLHRRRPAPAVPAAPEVLVPRGEAEALVRFAAIVHRDRHAPAAFLAAGRPSPDLPEPAALAITPLEIVPLDPAETPGT